MKEYKQSLTIDNNEPLTLFYTKEHFQYYINVTFCIRSLRDKYSKYILYIDVYFCESMIKYIWVLIINIICKGGHHKNCRLNHGADLKILASKCSIS